MACSKTCQKVSLCIGILLAIAGLALTLVGMFDLSSMSLSLSTEMDGTLTGSLPVLAGSCQYVMLVAKTADCGLIVSTASVGTLDTSLCGQEEIPEEGAERAPGNRNLENLDWTIGSEKVTDLKLAATLSFSSTDSGDSTFTSNEATWAMDPCAVFEEVFSVAARALIMIVAGVLILLAGLITFFIGCCCCLCCGAKE
ncbi:unnamed protein product [Effrenium voratum]|nr:unnamed protein product [Effrenium voratum]CAJ1438921.1 unnamed protein product [Effrenium voratum]CAJ1438922.1 unnamed protein product [Effrenium voratum]